jgi:MFS family permease
MKNRRMFYGWYVVAAACVITTISSGLAFYNLSVLLAAFVAERGFPVSLTSAATATFFIAGGVAGMLVGRLLDRFDPRYVILSGVAIGAAALAMVGHLREAWQLFAFNIALGFAFGGTGLVPMTMIVTRWFNTKRALALSIATTGHSLGGVLVAPFVALSVERAGLAGTGTWMAAAFLIGIAPLALLVLRPVSEPLQAGAAGAAPAAAMQPSISYLEARRTRYFLGVSITYFFVLGAHVGVITHLFRLASLRDGPRTAAIAIACLSGASIFGRLAGGWLLLRLDTRTFALALIAAQAVALAILAFAETGLAILVLVALFGLTMGNSLMMHPLLLAERFGTREYGRIFSVSQFIVVFGWASGPVAMGLLYDRSGSYTIPLLAMAAASVAGLLALLFATRR